VFTLIINARTTHYDSHVVFATYVTLNVFFLEKQTLNVWVNGQYVETENTFIDSGSEMSFEFENLKAAIKATSVDRKQGVIHQLFVDGQLIEENGVY
jgi:hypothetical protein